jgi:NUMOD4 motif
MTKIEEIFLPIKGYEGIYEISNKGMVRSLARIDCMGQHRHAGF